MTESLSFFEEQFSDIPLTQFIDLIAQPTWQDFCDEVKAVEFDVSNYNPNDDDACTEVGRRTNELRGKLDYDYIGMRSKVVGMGYSNYGTASSTNTNEPTYINTDNASFFGVNICFVNGRWQAMLEFDCAEDTPDLPKGTYNIPPNSRHLLVFSIEQGEKREDDAILKQKFIQDYHNQQALVDTTDFAQAPPDEQRRILESKIYAIQKKVPAEFCGIDVAIECTHYYTVYDDMNYATYDDLTPGFDVRDFLTDLSSTPSEERPALVGVIVGFEYPELTMLPPDQPLSANMLDMNDGSYCLVLRSDKERATHYVLPQTIADIY